MRALVHLVAISMACGGVASAAMAQQSVTITATADFQRGNNEGLVSTAQDRLTRDRITAGTVGSWPSSTALPSARTGHSAVAHNGFVYVLGGRDVNFTAMSDVLVAPINSDGSVGTWTATTALPSARQSHFSVTYNGFIYVIGGTSDRTAGLTDVLFAQINADGTVGTWTASTALPSGRLAHSAVAHDGFVYVLGGRDGANLSSEVIVAPINANGTLGAWTATTALPSGRAAGSSVAYNGFVYFIGGQPGPLNAVVVAAINGDGSLGAWSATTALPSARQGVSSVVYNGFIHVLGGFNPNIAVYGDTFAAPINADGSVGTWSTTTALPAARAGRSSIAHNGFAYVMGGEDSSFVPTSVVWAAPIDADAGNTNQTPNRLRGIYSHVLDLQSDSSSRAIILNGQVSPGGVVRLQVRVAPSATGVFGAETVIDPAPLGSAIQVSGTGRYVWIRLILDDTVTTDAAQPTYVLDITATPFSPPTTGVVFDGLGADIDTQTSTTTIEANWSGFTPAVGDTIAFYEWAIGTAPGLTNLQDWTSVGLATNGTNSSLALSVGVKYVSVRATGAAGLTSLPASSDGVQVLPPPSVPTSGDDKKKGRCGFGASATSGSLAGLLGGLALLAPFLRRRRWRT